jgi:alkylhydroperoxidase family enzyme
LARRLGWSEEQINDLANFEKRADFTEKEKVALRLAEKMTLDPNGVGEAQWTEIRRHFDEGEVVELLAAIGLFNYFNRFNSVLQMEPTK